MKNQINNTHARKLALALTAVAATAAEASADQGYEPTDSKAKVENMKSWSEFHFGKNTEQLWQDFKWELAVGGGIVATTTALIGLGIRLGDLGRGRC